jgi:hypothetical protein
VFSDSNAGTPSKSAARAGAGSVFVSGVANGRVRKLEEEEAMTRYLPALLCSLALAILASDAFAQIAAEGTIRGYVRDDQGGVLPGVTLTATTRAASTSFTGVTDANGFYRLLNLPPGTYTLVAELAGFSKFERTGLEVRAELNIEVDVAMQLGSVAETIQVTGDTPMLEVQKTVQAINISGDFQRSLPLSSRREWSDTLALTPGIMSRSTDQFGGDVYFLRGTENENHVVQIDGVDVGSFRQNWPGFYARLNTEAIDDVQVKTAGVDAAAPLAVGMVINIATPSGTNQLKGSAAAVYTAKAWNGNNNPGGTPVAASTFQPDVAIGGPLFKDRDWFFASMRYTRRSTGVSRDATLLANLKALVPNFQPFDNQGHLKYYFVKETTQFSPNHQLYVFFQRDVNAEDSNFQVNGGNFDVSAPGGNATGVRLSSVWGRSMTTRVLAGYNTKGTNADFGVFDGHLGTGGPSRPVHQTAFRSAGIVQGSGQIAVLDNLETRTNTPASKLTLSADLTYFRAGGWAGSHEIQIGTYLQPRLTTQSTTTYSGGGFALEELVLRDPANPAAGTIPFHRRFYNSPSIRTQSLLAHDNAVYVQDSWKPSTRLTINGGVRLDWIKNTDQLFNLVTIDDLAVGPRAGGTYVLTAQQKDIVHASWGRVADVPNASYLAPSAAGTTRTGQRDEYSSKLDGVFDIALVTPPGSSANPNLRTDPGRRQSWVDEFVAGYRRQLPGQISLDVSAMRRNYKHAPALVEVNGIYDNNVFRGYKDESLNGIFLLTDNKWNSFVYQGLEFTVTKRTARVQLITTYTRAWQHLDGTWQPNDPASFIQPSAFPNDAGLGTIRGAGTNSLSGTADVRNPMWEKHQFRTGLAYAAPWGIQLATNFSVQSGPWSGPVVTRIAAPDPQFGPPTVTLSNGRVVSNPLATTIRFAYPTRGDGQIKANYLKVINLRAGRTFAFGQRRFEAAFDIFNLLNGAVDQQFLDGGNQLYSSNYALKPDGSFFGVNRQPPRAGQLTVRCLF